jgi:hypothetical protein
MNEFGPLKVYVILSPVLWDEGSASHTHCCQWASDTELTSKSEPNEQILHSVQNDVRFYLETL